MKQKPGTSLAHALRSPPARTAGPAAPGPLEDVGQDEHRHVAAHAVALPGDLHQLADHRLLRGRIAVVELQRVRPAGEVRVAAVGQQQVAAAPLRPRCSSAARAPGRPRSRRCSTRDGPRPRGDPSAVWLGTKSSISRRPRCRSRSRSRASAASPPRSRMHRVAGDREARSRRCPRRAGPAASPRTRAATRDCSARPACPAGPVCQTLRSQTQSKPISARRSSSASGMSSSVAGRPSARDSSVSQTRVLI